MRIASTALQTAMQAVRQPREPLIRCRIRDGCLEVASVNKHDTVLCDARIPLDSEVSDSSGFAVDRRSLKRLAAQSDDSVQVCLDEEMIAFQAGEHVYASLSEAEELDLCPMPSPDPAARMETTPAQLWDLMGRVRSSCVAFSAEHGEMWLSGKKGPGSLHGGTVRIPAEHTTVPDGGESVSIIEKDLLRRVLRRILDEDPELTVDVGHDEPIVLEWEMSGVECRQAIAPRIPDPEDDHSSWDIKAEVSR